MLCRTGWRFQIELSGEVSQDSKIINKLGIYHPFALTILPYNAKIQVVTICFE